jgi:hypothetical protein
MKTVIEGWIARDGDDNTYLHIDSEPKWNEDLQIFRVHLPDRFVGIDTEIVLKPGECKKVKITIEEQ